jgi:hypothetical protein
MTALARWPRWLIIALSTLWIATFPVGYELARAWWTLRRANGLPCAPNTMCLHALSIESTTSAVELGSLVAFTIGAPLVLLAVWRRARTRQAGPELREP